MLSLRLRELPRRMIFERVGTITSWVRERQPFVRALIKQRIALAELVMRQRRFGAGQKLVDEVHVPRASDKSIRAAVSPTFKGLRDNLNSIIWYSLEAC